MGEYLLTSYPQLHPQLATTIGNHKLQPRRTVRCNHDCTRNLHPQFIRQPSATTIAPTIFDLVHCRYNLWSTFVVAIVVATPCNCGCNLWLPIVGAIVGAVLAADLGICATRPVIQCVDNILQAKFTKFRTRLSELLDAHPAWQQR